MKICILENDIFDAAFESEFKRPSDFFLSLFKYVQVDWYFEVFNTKLGEYPINFEKFDAVILTGSASDSFSDEPWIVELRKKITELLKTDQKILGICFGHQLIALCLGAQVGRSEKGWGVGRQTYTCHQTVGMQDWGGDEISLLASHQDQVKTLPPGAQLLVSNEFCPIAGFQLKKNVLCLQPHPEFIPQYSEYLLNKRRQKLGENLYDRALKSLSLGHEGVRMAKFLVAFVEAA